MTTAARKRASARELVDLWVDLFKRHNLLTFASAIAFQTLVAFVAFLLLALGILHAVGETKVWTNELGPAIAPKVLAPVFTGMNATVDKVFHSSSIGLIVFGAVLAIWEISGVVRACMGAFATIYEVDDERPWWIRFPLSIALSVPLIIALVGSILLTTAAKSAVHGAWGTPFAIGRWILAIALMAAAFGALVRFAPAEPRPARWASAGAVLVVVAWVVQSLLFALYLRTFANYRSAAGSLLGVYFLTTYFYVGAIILMVGIELDEELRKDVRGKKQRGILEIVRDVV